MSPGSLFHDSILILKTSCGNVCDTQVMCTFDDLEANLVMLLVCKWAVYSGERYRAIMALLFVLSLVLVCMSWNIYIHVCNILYIGHVLNIHVYIPCRNKSIYLSIKHKFLPTGT